jgi:hypothetical protein
MLLERRYHLHEIGKQFHKLTQMPSRMLLQEEQHKHLHHLLVTMQTLEEKGGQ